MVQKYTYQKLRDASKLLKNYQLYYILKDIFNEEDYLEYAERLEGDLLVYSNQEGKQIYLDLSDGDPVFTWYVDDFFMEQVKVYLSKCVGRRDKVFVDCITMELRSNGVIVTEIDKVYSECAFDSFYREVISQVERTYVYRKDTLKGKEIGVGMHDVIHVVSDWSYEGIDPDFQSTVKILKAEDNCICVDLDGEDISECYRSLDGCHLVTRISQLFHGDITKVNSRDIYLIHLNKLEMDAFGMRKLKGIDSLEREIAGCSLRSRDQGYCTYVEEFLRNQFGTVCNNFDSRIELLRCITKVDGTVYQDLEADVPNAGEWKDVSAQQVIQPKVKKRLISFLNKKKRNDR